MAKGRRGSGSDKRRRSRQSLIRWSDEEFAAVSDKADKAGLAVAAFLRAAALGDPGPRAKRRPPADYVLLRKVLGQQGRIGNNLNQIARALNIGQQYQPPDLQQALTACHDIRKAIYEALGKTLSPEP